MFGKEDEGVETTAQTPDPKLSKMEAYKAKPAVGRFRVLVGKHHEGGVTYGKGLPAGDVVDSKSDLEKLNTAAGRKFERIGKKRPAPAAQKQVPEEPDENWEEDAEPDGLEDMTVEELKKTAEEEEVDLPAYSRKADIVAAIREARKGK